MQLVKHEITLDNDTLDLYAIGDLHIASKAFNKPAFLKIVDEISMKGAHWIGMGDFGESISIADRRRFDPDTIRPLYRDNLARYHQLEVIELKEMLEPIKSTCLGILEGNHETALRTSQFDMIWELCNYFAWHNLTTQAFILLNIHYPKRQKTLDCDLFVAHGYGGARTKGGAVAKLQRLLDQFLADIVLMAHQHIAQPVIDAKLRLPKRVDKLYLDKKIRLGFFVPSFYETYKEGIDTYASRGCWGPSIIGAWKGTVKWIRVQGCDKLLIESPVTNLEG